MKKLLGIFAIASFASIPAVQADIAGFEVGGYQWKPDYDGTLVSTEGTVIGSNIDLQSDLGFSDESHNIIWASLEHPVPMLPNFKIVSSDLDVSAFNTLTRDIVFAGETYSVSDDVTTVIDMSNTEYTFYWEILDNWVNLDLGLTLRSYDGEIALSTPTTGSNLNEQEELDFTIPLFYAKGRFDLPFTGFFVDASANIISYDDDSISDLMVGLGYESEIGFGASLGYRTFDLDIEEDDIVLDAKFDGTYISAFFHF